MNPFTLYDITLNETTQLLKDTYWNLNCDGTDNPFLVLPSSIIDELISRVVRNSATNPLKASDLHLLLTTSRVKNFKFEDVKLLSKELDDILKDLVSSCDNLVSIKLKGILCRDIYITDINRYTLECLFSACSKLEYIESSLEFNLNVLCHCVNLKKLVLDFPVDNKLCDFLEIDGHLIPHNSLRVLEVSEDVSHPLSYIEIAVILRYCTELIEVNFDISKSLEYLHTEKLCDGTLETKYKLQRCYLGSGYMDVENTTVSRDAVYIASLTCPDLRELDVLVNDYNVIHALGDFNHLVSLLIQWETVHGGDYHQGILPLLEKPGFGHKLKSLVIVNFSNVEFSSIGKKCPNLEDLRVEFLSETNNFPFPETSFGNLINLHIEHIDDGECNYRTLIGLLSNASNLKFLNINKAGSLSDSVLDQILKTNSLNKVKELRATNCGLTVLGLQKLASSLTSLEFLQMSSSLVSLDVAATVIHEINPRVILIAANSDE